MPLKRIDRYRNACQDALATLVRWRELYPDEWDDRDEQTFVELLTVLGVPPTVFGDYDES